MPSDTGRASMDCWPHFVGVKREREEDNAWAVQPFGAELGLRSVVSIYRQTGDKKKLELVLLTDGVANCGEVPLEDDQHISEWVKVHEEARDALAQFPFCFVELQDGSVVEYSLMPKIKTHPDQGSYRTIKRSCRNTDPTFLKFRKQGWTECSAEGGMISRAVYTCKITYVQTPHTRNSRYLEGTQNIYSGYEVFPEYFRIKPLEPMQRNLRELEGVMVARRRRCLSLTLEGLIKYNVKMREDGSARVSKTILHKIGLFARERHNDKIPDDWNTILARIGEYNAGNIMQEMNGRVDDTVRNEPCSRHIKITEGVLGQSIGTDENKRMLKKFQFSAVVDKQTGKVVRAEQEVVKEAALVRNGLLLVHPKNGTPMEQLVWTDTFLGKYFKK